MNRRALVVLAALAFSVGQGFSPADEAQGVSAATRVDALRTAQRKYGLDPATSLASRVRPASRAMLEDFGGAPPPPGPSGTPSPPPPHRATSHVLTEAERTAFTLAMDGVTPLQRHVLRERLQAIYFVDAPDMPGTALTRTLNPDDPSPLFDLIVRGGVFRETVSEWLTSKERGCFDAAGSPLSVSVEAGAFGAIRYVMLHEAAHMTDRALVLTPPWRAGAAPDPAASSFTRGVWKNPLAPVEAFDSPLLRKSRFRREGTVLPIAQAQAMYEALRQTPFVSLYAAASWSEDLAEQVTVVHWTSKLGQPFRFVVRDGTREVFAYEPMTSPLVQRRLDAVARFYEER